jgi:hypothetical protein
MLTWFKTGALSISSFSSLQKQYGNPVQKDYINRNTDKLASYGISSPISKKITISAI